MAYGTVPSLGALRSSLSDMQAKRDRLKDIKNDLVKALETLFELDCVRAEDYEAEKIEAIDDAQTALANAKEGR